MQIIKENKKYRENVKTFRESIAGLMTRWQVEKVKLTNSMKETYKNEYRIRWMVILSQYVLLKIPLPSTRKEIMTTIEVFNDFCEYLK